MKKILAAACLLISTATWAAVYETNLALVLRNTDSTDVTCKVWYQNQDEDLVEKTFTIRARGHYYLLRQTPDGILNGWDCML